MVVTVTPLISESRYKDNLKWEATPILLRSSTKIFTFFFLDEGLFLRYQTLDFIRQHSHKMSVFKWI